MLVMNQSRRWSPSKSASVAPMPLQSALMPAAWVMFSKTKDPPVPGLRYKREVRKSLVRSSSG
jgi:hypothetical protein